jgi:hypothetical protein
MTNEDKQVIREYMGWCSHQREDCEDCSSKYGTCDLERGHLFFDLNDAGLCVQRMVEKDDYWSFWAVACSMYDDNQDVTIWLWNADNFFAAMVSWLKEGKGK